MIRIRDLLDHYNRDELTFNEVMCLYIEGKLELKDGELSTEDVQTLYKECDLDAMGTRTILVKGEQRETVASVALDSIDGLVKLCTDRDNILRERLKNESGRKHGSMVATQKEAFGAYIGIAEACEKFLGYGEHAHLRMLAIRYRDIASRQCVDPKNRKEMRAVADNLACLAELESVNGAHTICDRINRAIELYDTILAGIRNNESAMRSEENAKLGVALLLRYRITKDMGDVARAEQVLSAYVGLHPDSHFKAALLDIVMLKERYNGR